MIFYLNIFGLKNLKNLNVICLPVCAIEIGVQLKHIELYVIEFYAFERCSALYTFICRLHNVDYILRSTYYVYERYQVCRNLFVRQFRKLESLKCFQTLCLV